MTIVFVSLVSPAVVCLVSKKEVSV